MTESRPSLAAVFIGLMLGMFLAAVNQTIIAPAMPRIVAELGGMEHYSWIVVSRTTATGWRTGTSGFAFYPRLHKTA